MKICTKCRIDTPNDMMIQGGEGSWCKQCTRDYSRRFAKTDRGYIYSIYNGMIARCYNSKSNRFEKYGGNGVKIDDRWLGENGFESFFSWAQQQDHAMDKDYQIDKDIGSEKLNINPHIYSEDTCRFVSRSENQRNYSTLLKNNTSGYTGVDKGKVNGTWLFRLHIEHGKNINRGVFKSAIEAAKSREALIISNDLNFKTESVGSSMLLLCKPIDVVPMASNYNNIQMKNNKYIGVINMNNGTRKSIGTHVSDRLAAESRNNLIKQYNVQSINRMSIMFGYERLTKEDL